MNVGCENGRVNTDKAILRLANAPYNFSFPPSLVGKGARGLDFSKFWTIALFLHYTFNQVK